MGYSKGASAGKGAAWGGETWDVKGSDPWAVSWSGKGDVWSAKGAESWDPWSSWSGKGGVGDAWGYGKAADAWSGKGGAGNGAPGKGASDFSGGAKGEFWV